jgi:sugar/nucleoside kinase (ribokinase family)
VVNTDTNERIGKAILNKKLLAVKVSSADWHHIAYINQIKDISFIKDIKDGIISADITKENPKNCVSHLGVLDFLFISKEDLFDNIIEISKKTKGWVIAHDPTGSIYSNGEKIYEYEIPSDLILSNISILGAGDSFASSFISCFLESDDINKSIEQAHKKTTFLLKNR